MCLIKQIVLLQELLLKNQSALTWYMNSKQFEVTKLRIYCRIIYISNYKICINEDASKNI